MLALRSQASRLDLGPCFLLLDRFADCIRRDLVAVKVNGEISVASLDVDHADTINTFQRAAHGSYTSASNVLAEFVLGIRVGGDFDFACDRGGTTRSVSSSVGCAACQE